MPWRHEKDITPHIRQTTRRRDNRFSLILSSLLQSPFARWLISWFEVSMIRGAETVLIDTRRLARRYVSFPAEPSSRKNITRSSGARVQWKSESCSVARADASALDTGIHSWHVEDYWAICQSISDSERPRGHCRALDMPRSVTCAATCRISTLLTANDA